MPAFRLRCLFFLVVFSSTYIRAQTVLYPGDIIVLAWGSNMQLCGLSPLSDEMSFMCFQDITTGTEIDITDNGWEHANAGFWGDSEGTLRMTRTGGTIPAGTVITLQGQLLAGNWVYRTISPDIQWTFTNLNVPGGDFNIDPGGDQVTFMQGGTWDNQGGGANRAIYDGRLIWAANSTPSWAANATVNTSNLPPQLLPCNFQDMSAGLETAYIKYIGPTTAATHFEWIERAKYYPDWLGHNQCGVWSAWPPNYVGATLPIEQNMGIGCWNCSGCNPFEGALVITVPWEGQYNVVYTDGTDTFELEGISGINGIGVTVTENITFTMISVEQVGGCKVFSNFSPMQTTFTAPNADPGEYAEVWVCAEYQPYLELIYFLGGTPDPGGVWVPPIGFNQYYFPQNGPGLFTYTIDHDPPHTCPPDTASVRIYFVEASESIVEVSCDQNGTPYDIYDDRIQITLTVIAPHFGDDYYITASSGSITPGVGKTGIPQVFFLDPGTAIGPDLSVTIEGWQAFWCKFDFEIPAPGYCSDPCDYDMITTLTGPEDICVNACPDNPGELTIDINGGTGPYKMDFSLSAPTYPTWNFNGINTNGFTQMQICIDTVPAPIYNPLSGLLILPQSLGGSGVTFTLENVYDKFDCIGALDPAELFISVHSLPAISTTSLALCEEAATNVDLTEYDQFISFNYDVTWFDGNPFLGGDELFNPTGVNLKNVVQLWASVADDYCENAIQVPFAILPEPDLDSVPPIAICQGMNIVLQDIVLIDAGNSMATYTFHAGLPPDSTNMLDSMFFMPMDSTTIYVHATAGMCFDTLPVQIFVEDYPDFTLQAQPCDLINGTYSLLFTSSADSIHASTGVVVNNPTGQDAVNGIPNNTNVTIEILNPTGLCRDTFFILAPNCNCPLINQPVPASSLYAVCEGEPLPLVSVTVDPGLVANWYDVPSGGVAFLQNSLTFQPVVPADAIYYIEAFDPSSACYSIRTAVTLQVHPFAILQQQIDPVVCDGETINLDALAPAVLNSVAGNGGWFRLPANQPASGILQPQNGETWQYLFTTDNGNCVTRDTITAIVNPLPAIDVYDILCDDVQLTFQILFTSDADVVLATSGSLVQTPGADSFALQDIPFDTDIQFQLQYVSTGCSASIGLPAPDCSCPALLQDVAHELCSDPGTVDLSTFQGPGVDGTWQMVSTPPGSNPATLSGADFLGFQADPGIYTLRFVRSAILANCVDSALFELTLQTSPFADAGIDRRVCAPDVIVLSGTAGGSNTIYNWQTSGTGVLNNPGALSTSYTPTLADITSGSVNFTLSATDQTGFCPDASETITVIIDGTSYYILNAGTQTYCDTLDVLIDLDALISFGANSGEWFFPDTVSAPVIGSSQINPSTLTAGTYTIFYTTSNAVPPCKNDTTGVNIIIENCACPSVAISSPAQDLCSASGSLNLNTLKITTEPGAWTIVSAPAGSKPATINGAQFVATDSDAGIYRLRFTLSNPVSGCPAYAEVDLEVIGTPTLDVLTVECADGLQSWQAVVTSSPGSLLNTSLGSIVPLGSNRYRIENITLNTPIQVSASSGNGLCITTINIANADCECTLSINNLPDEVALCPSESIVLQPQVLDPKGSVTSFWIVANDSLYQNTLNVTQAGNYQFVALDELGCEENHNVEVTYYQEMIPGVSWVDITCPGDQDGSIVVQGIVGGTGPFFISINGGAMQPVSAFPYFIDGLSAGNYHIELFDANGCTTDFDVQIRSASSESLSLGPDKTILVGDSVLIDPLLSFSPDSFYWSGDVELLLNPQQLSQWIQPETDQAFQLSGIDSKGCLYTDDLKIRVLLQSSIYVPNVFSPNGDGINDILAPMADPSITRITYFEIYSRWGELVYSIKDVAPNQGNIGWDGTLHNESMQPGVFVYRLGAINKRGKEFLLYGDVTLLR